VKEQGGRLVRRGGVVSVEAVSITPEIDASVRAHQTDLLLLVPESTAKAAPSPYADADAVIKAVYAKGGQVVKDDAGRCTLHLLKPDADLEAAFARLYAEVCGEFLTEAEFLAEMSAMRPSP
jgi:hypothetical protein